MKRGFLFALASVTLCVSCGADPAEEDEGLLRGTSSNSSYDIYNSAAYPAATYSDNRNYGNYMGEQEIHYDIPGSVRLSVRAAGTLAGAVVSIKLGNQEFIHSGGHGAAVSYLTHGTPPSGSGNSYPSECWNPTENGSARDDCWPGATIYCGNNCGSYGNPNKNGSYGAPWHGQSSSAMNAFSSTSVQLYSDVWMAYYIPAGWKGWYGCTARGYYDYHGIGNVNLSGVRLKKWVTVGPGSNGPRRPNVIRFKAQIIVPNEYHAQWDSVLSLYLLSNLYYQGKRVIPRSDGSYTIKDIGNKQESGYPQMLCNGSGSYCLGTLSMNASADQGLASSLETRRHYLAWEQGSAYIWNIWKAKGVKGNNSRKFHLTTYVAVGSQDSVAASLTAIWNHR